MKLLKFTLLLAGCFAFCPLIAQDPYFVQGIYADKTEVCYGEPVRLSARVAHATYYEFRFLDTESGEWNLLSSGSTDTTVSLIEHLIYSVSSSLTVRVLLKNSRSEISGETLGIRAHQPVFDIHPQDLIQCNGGEVTFRAQAAGGQSYQWESSTDGLSFSPLSVTTKFKDVQTPGLKVTGIINSHHGQVFRCRVKDAYQCEALSQPATLSVNQLSTAVSPTTSAPFCEGDTATFFPASVSGTSISCQWWMRKTGQPSYTILEESEKFSGTTTPSLKVNGILPEENSYRIRVGFTARSQNTSGQADSTVCYLESTRANYTIHPRPALPSPLDSLQSCGPARFLISGTENYTWYEDTLHSPVKSGSSFYQTPELDTSRVYHYSVKDGRSCESYRLPVKVFVRPVPAQTFSIPEGICPDETRIPLTMNGEIHTPLYFFTSGTGLPPADSLPAVAHTEIELPALKNTDHLTFHIYSKNEYCTSDTSELRLNIFPSTRIHPTLQDLSVCETEKIYIQAGFEAKDPVTITWYQNGAALENTNGHSLLIPSAQRSHEGVYTVKVSGRCGEEMSAPFTIAVLPATTFLTQPQDTTVCENSAATFRINARGNGPLNYQWFINDQAVPGNADSLLIPQVSLALHRARVVCRVSSACSQEVFSDTATLTVRPLPSPPGIADTLIFCTSASVINLAREGNALNWYNLNGELLSSPEVNAIDIHNRIFSVSQADLHGCESALKPFLTLVYPAFTLTAVSDKEQLCLTGNFNRSVQLGVFTSTPDPVNFRLVQEGRLLGSNTTGDFWVQEPGLYTIYGEQQHCSAGDSLRIHPANVTLALPPVVSPAETCFGGAVTLEAASSYSGGMFYWWSGAEEVYGFSTSQEVAVQGVVSDTAFFVSYGIQTGGIFCESPRSRVTVTTSAPLKPGRIADNNTVNCAGYNPPLINNLEAPSESSHMQWQFTESCEGAQWQDIPGATGLSYNPGVLQTGTCFRRKVWNTCDTLFSNIVTLRIAPDPLVTISAGKDIVDPGDSLHLTATLQGGAGNCTVTWQVNPVSSAASSPNWTNAGEGPALRYANPEHHGLLHFRARVSCDLSSCNLAGSNVISVRFLHPPVVTPLNILSQTQQMINCYGSVSYLQVQAEGEGNVSYQWQRKLPGDSAFTDLAENNYLSGVQTASLRIGSTGNAESLHQSQFRCIVSDTTGLLYSAEIPLVVNRLLGSLPNQTLCAGNDLHADLTTAFSISGSPLHFEWQHRPGTGYPWVALNDTGQVSGSSTSYLTILHLPELEQVQYRCAVSFASHNGSCVETTDLMTLKVGVYPEKPQDIDMGVCQGENLEKIMLYPPESLKVSWYHLHEAPALTRQPDMGTAIPGDYFMQYTYVSDKKCESPRALIRVTVHPSPPLPFNTTPAVYDETESLTFSAEGENLKWYRTKTLKSYEPYPPVFTSTGEKSYYVTQTDFRGCESERLLIRSEIRPVFRIVSQPRDQANCDGNTVTFSVRISGGTDVTYQWQREYSGLFADIGGATDRDYKISDAGTAPDMHGTRYRCIIRSGENQLISTPAALYVNRLKPSLPGITLCAGEVIDFSRYRDSISGTPVRIEWQKRTGNTYSTVFEASGLTETYPPGEDHTGIFRLRVTFQSSGGTCVRNSNAIPVTQHRSPDVIPADTLIQRCRFSPTLSGADLSPGKTWWQLPGEEWKPTLEISTQEEAEHLLTYKTEGENNCFSEPAKMTLKISSCYFAGQTDTSVSISVPALQADEWNYLYLENGEIFAALYTQEANTGPVLMNLTATARASLRDSSGNRFYPRSLHTANELPVKIRFYMSRHEIEHYTGPTGGSVMLLYQEEFTAEGRPPNGVLWLKDTLKWENTDHKNYVYFEFETVSAGAYFLWRNQVPAGQLRVDTDLQTFPLVSAENLRPMPAGHYLIRKSREGVSWQEWRSGVANNEKISDVTPFIPETYYRLDFDFGKNIRAALDTAKATLHGKYPECILLENPVREGRNIGLYFPGLQKSHTQLVTLNGREVPILHITENGDHYRISPVNVLTKGSYYLKAQNRYGLPCTKRIIVY